ncbi:hypothetical protein DEU56DRAFT_233988 [Suillus clintonianus]|uniref:uncharacterized protein n=1 Tax=Suillus clintonianus TaxID=1904413 RepID=UPI001B871406|nr:uncharacterized protein DEU56DRAFT_233988 [Suillus clintonianus]KAG2156405.1 hypothetical protein DEU56DRAFT_233988 [Suillus clintonianus]
MATKFNALDEDSKPVSRFNLPPSYDAIPSSVSADSTWFGRSVFPFFHSKQECLSRIRAIVSSPDFTSSSVAQTVSACADTLPPAEFSKLLQKHNIEQHTPLYWAIVNNQREAFWALTKFISKFSPACSADLRLACMTASDHALFAQLNLGHTVNPEDQSLRCFLGCPPDESEVEGLGNNIFVGCLRFRMFQKRLRITQKLGVEFIAGSRIWVMSFYLGPEGRWRVKLSLSEHSFPARPDIVLQIEAHRRLPDSPIPEALIVKLNHSSDMLVPKERVYCFPS